MRILAHRRPSSEDPGCPRAPPPSRPALRAAADAAEGLDGGGTLGKERIHRMMPEVRPQ